MLHKIWILIEFLWSWLISAWLVLLAVSKSIEEGGGDIIDIKTFLLLLEMRSLSEKLI